MCVINITLTISNGVAIETTAEGRYKEDGESTWIPFSIDTTSPQTPNITVLGLYDLEVRVQSSEQGNEWSEWQATQFLIAGSCAGSQSVQVGIDVTNPAQACINSHIQKFIADGYIFATAPAIYADYELLVKEPEGYYSDGNTVRYWDGVDDFSTYGTCVSYTQTSLRRDPDWPIDACNASTSTYYLITGQNLDNATAIYSDNLGTVALDGYYSNGAVTRYWDGTTLDSEASCQTLVSVDLRIGGTRLEACEGTSRAYFLPQGEMFPTASHLYDVSNGSAPAIEGFYADVNNVVREWNGTTEFVGENDVCPLNLPMEDYCFTPSWACGFSPPDDGTLTRWDSDDNPIQVTGICDRDTLVFISSSRTPENLVGVVATSCFPPVGTCYNIEVLLSECGGSDTAQTLWFRTINAGINNGEQVFHSWDGVDTYYDPDREDWILTGLCSEEDITYWRGANDQELTGYLPVGNKTENCSTCCDGTVQNSCEYLMPEPVPEPVTLYGGTSASLACSTSVSFTYYVPEGEDFANATRLMQYSHGVLVDAGGGYYTDGTDLVRFWSSSAFVVDSLCSDSTEPPGNDYYTRVYTNPSGLSACNQTLPADPYKFPLYTAVREAQLVVGDIAYNNHSPLSSPYNGNSPAGTTTGGWYSTSQTFSMKIDANGVITAIDDCGVEAPDPG